MSRFDLLELGRTGPVHFMGIGGAGMTPLADMLLRAGVEVTGCDARLGPGARSLEGRGARVFEGHHPLHVEGCAAVVTTSAVPPSHPEIAAARSRGIPVLKRAEALGAIVNQGRVIGISGTHGKTTTTTLTTAVLAAAGMDPTGFVGARVPAWGGNLRPGGTDLYVVEADEYDRSFHTLRPYIAVVTTLEADHLEYYGSLEAVEEAFAHFVGMVPPDGLVAVCADDPGAVRLLERVEARVEAMTYGLAEGADLRATELEFRGGQASFDVVERGARLGRATLQAPGIHNVLNALAAVAVARRLGVGWDAVAEGLASYAGVDRRFEQVGEAGGVLFVDDYAHHPTEVAATLGAARAAYGDRRLVAVFQPHLYSRTRDFKREFGQALALADVAFVADVFAAREAAVPGITGELVADQARAAGVETHYVPDRAALPERVAAALRPGDLCLTLGAGDLDAAARDLLRLLGAPASAGARP